MDRRTDRRTPRRRADLLGERRDHHEQLGGYAARGRRAHDAPILNQPAGALIARIGDYGPIFIGDRRSITAPVSGRVYLGVNDDHLADAFTVTVAIQPRTF